MTSPSGDGTEDGTGDGTAESSDIRTNRLLCLQPDKDCQLGSSGHPASVWGGRKTTAPDPQWFPFQSHWFSSATAPAVDTLEDPNRPKPMTSPLKLDRLKDAEISRQDELCLWGRELPERINDESVGSQWCIWDKDDANPDLWISTWCVMWRRRRCIETTKSQSFQIL